MKERKNGNSRSNREKGFGQFESTYFLRGGVVDSWSDGNGNWWRKYSDGFIEQGGKSDKTTTGPVSLNTSFSGTNYVAMIIPIDHGKQEAMVIKVYEKTTSTFNFTWWGVLGGTYWFACGY